MLIVLTGNLSRYLYLRPLVDAMPRISARWMPVRTWVHGDWLRFLPGGLRLRLRHLLDSRKLFLRRPGDAVVMHALDTYSWFGLWHRLLRSKSVLISNPDGVEYDDKTGVRRWLLQNAVDRTSAIVAWSNHVAELTIEEFPEARDRVVVLHPGIPLDRWPLREASAPGERFRLLFVGGNAWWKGLDTVLDAFETKLAETCCLDVVTQTMYLSPELLDRMRGMDDVDVHLDLQPGSDELQGLYAAADAFVLPTRGDWSPWVAIEALATGVPVIISGIRGIPDIIQDRRTGLIIEPDDPAGLANAVRELQESPELSAQLVRQGRQHVEDHFDGARNAERLMTIVIDAIEGRPVTLPA